MKTIDFRNSHYQGFAKARPLRTRYSFNLNFIPLKGVKLACFFVLAFLCYILPSPSHATKTYHIAVIITNDSKPYIEALSGFYESLNASNIDYSATEHLISRVSKEKIIADLKQFKPDIVHTIGTAATIMTKDIIKNIPILFSMVLNPVASGLIKNMKTSGNNLTGASLDIPPLIQFKRIKDKLPSIKRIGVLYNEAETGIVVAESEKAAKSLGMELVKAKIETTADVPGELYKLIEKIDVLWSVADKYVFTKETIREILLVSLKNKIPFIGLGPSFIKSGALIVFDLDERDVGRQAAVSADRVLAGESPSDIPITVPENVELIINEVITNLLGIDIQ